METDHSKISEDLKMSYILITLATLSLWQIMKKNLEFSLLSAGIGLGLSCTSLILSGHPPLSTAGLHIIAMLIWCVFCLTHCVKNFDGTPGDK